MDLHRDEQTPNTSGGRADHTAQEAVVGGHGDKQANVCTGCSCIHFRFQVAVCFRDTSCCHLFRNLLHHHSVPGSAVAGASLGCVYLYLELYKQYFVAGHK